ncbi:MAG: hypothetical protein ABH884_03085 [Candidatus Komeilibacteria bacterium]
MNKFEQNSAEQERLNRMADEFDALQKDQNNGRGVSCVQSVIIYLRAGKLEDAKQICRWDHDKIINYPKIKKYVRDVLFADEDEHPWSTLERLQAETKK